MGVIYKLKSEVIQFILDQKKTNPNFSCRKLAKIVDAKFKVSVSKSSINSVIKSASLSSPVGRHPSGEAGVKKFKIPAKRKEQLFTKATKARAGIAPASQKTKSTGTVKKAPPPLPKVPERSIEIHKKMSNLKPVKRASGSAIGLRGKLSSPIGLLDGMGCFFLKAAEWSLADTSILSQVLSHYVPEHEKESVFNTCSILPYLEPFEIKEIAALEGYKGQGLWTVSGLSGKMSPSQIFRMLESMKDIKRFNIEYSFELAQALEEISSMRFTLSDGTGFAIDSEMLSVWDSNVQTEAYRTNHTATTLMSKQIVNNLSPAILCSLPGVESISKQFYNFLACFENLPGKNAKSLSLHNIKGREIARFESISKQRRLFISAVWPWQVEFNKLIEESEGLPFHRVQIEELGKEVSYCEIYTNILIDQVDGSIPPARAYVLRDSPEAAPSGAVLTNILTEEASAEAVISSYLLRWPNLQRGNGLARIQQYQSSEPGGAKIEGESLKEVPEINLTTSLQMNVKHYTAILNKYCCQHFFPFHYTKNDITSNISSIYGLSGSFRESDQYILVKLSASNRPKSNKEDIENSIKRVNESDIIDPKGRKLLMSLGQD